MSGESELLQRIVGILNSDPVQNINFSFRKVRISGADSDHLRMPAEIQSRAGSHQGTR